VPRRVLRWELVLILLLAFAPGALGLLVLLVSGGSNGPPETKLGPATATTVFDLFLSWAPVLVIAYVLARNREGWAAIGLGRLTAADARTGVALGFASFWLVVLLSLVFSQFGTRSVDFLPTGLPLWFRAIDALTIAVTAGVTEEVVVRGYAQTRLEQLALPTAVVVLLPTALWGILHLYEGAGAALTIFCLGLMYAVYFNLTRRLWPLVLAHGLFDLTQLVLLLASRH
jgi:membrane protease YdiL (CAAX protease family)